jgi:putative tricarboxylic transport membrane protein
MVLFAPLLARWAIAFGPAEYFVLMVLAIVALSGLANERPLKTLLAALLGLFLSSVGIDANSGVYRFTFDSLHVADGIQFVVLVLGLFSISEILLLLEKTHSGHRMVEATGRMLFNAREAASVFWVNLRCGVLGFFMGVLPGAGATLASAVAYMSEKRLAGSSGKFGQGDLRGLAAPETAIGGAACGAMVPMLTLGVPGSGTTAVMIGALSLYNITPGPLLFQEQPQVVWGLIASLFVANVMLIILNVPMVRVFTRILAVPNWALVPAIAIITSIGVYAVHATTFDLVLMVTIGVLGYILRKLDFPLSPVLLGFILGGLMEQNLRRALSISNGELQILWSSPITMATWGLVALMLALPVWRAWRRR